MNDAATDDAENGAILVETADGIATITLNRPERMNSLSPAMLRALPVAISQAVDTGARVIVITGSGRGFCAGANLGAGRHALSDLGTAIETLYNPLALSLANSPVPIVTAVNGAAAGAGVGLALGGDIIVAARSAYFLLAFVNIGLVPDAGSSWLVAKAVGRVKALEMALLGERLSADDALSCGLVTRVVDDADLLPAAMAIAHKLAALPPLALGMIRRQIGAALDEPFAATLDIERDNQRRAGHTADHAEGVAAFREKRAACFNGS
ncbi:enoyl-CoA hydratase-related protein [Sphingomonas sp.]|uniref:enoyl-CoA hydratase-related protein n=1 Tax=Sphingomonas sp. TaxID=28214 RepID=UPI0025EF935A|nr:enoyl-CoA hydratase-related protein [Sphingomonas sp.]